jgi:hypothetical protein
MGRSMPTAEQRFSDGSEEVMAPIEITADIIRLLIDYDPETGKLFWRARPASMFPTLRACYSWNGRYAGKEAFTAQTAQGYLKGALFNRTFRAHRVAFAAFHGRWPDEVDHINGNGMDNRIDNLREVSRLENAKNLPMQRKNTSGHIGVHWHKSARKWVASIGVSGRVLHLGCFASIEQAVQAREAAAVEHGFHPNHGRVSDRGHAHG